MKNILLALVLSVNLFACGGPQNLTTETNDAGYLVSQQSALTFTIGIPAPWVCFNGFDPYHYPQEDTHGGSCMTQPTSNTWRTNLPVTVCSPGQVPAGYAEITTHVTYSPPDPMVPDSDNCSRIKLSYWNGYLPINVLNLNGWYASAPYSGGATHAFQIWPTKVRVGPNRWVTFSSAYYLNTGGCGGIDPDVDDCVSIANAWQTMDKTIDVSGVSVQSMRFEKYNSLMP